MMRNSIHDHGRRLFKLVARVVGHTVHDTKAGNDGSSADMTDLFLETLDR